ncbi:protein of unknown function (plasmid) [Caballeronia sp. S22]
MIGYIRVLAEVLLLFSHNLDPERSAGATSVGRRLSGDLGRLEDAGATRDRHHVRDRGGV